MSLASGRIAVVGATGVVGREVLSILEERGVPAAKIMPLASARSAGRTVPYAGGALTVHEAAADSFHGVGVAIFAASSGVARALSPHAIFAGATVIDNSSAFRMNEGVPLVVPEINGALVTPTKGRGPVPLVANPNCSTIILLLAVEPLRRRFGLSSIVVSTYQAVSGAGQAGLDALTDEINARRSESDAGGEPKHSIVDTSPFTEPCFLNVFSHNSPVDPATGLNGEERKMIDESRKILNLPTLAVSPTCVRVPVMRAHSESITLGLTSPATYAEVLAAYEGFPGVRVVDDRAGNRFPTPLKAAGTDDVLVGRIRPDPALPLDAQGRSVAWCLFACGDQLRKGAALNAVQIAELIS